MGGGGSGPGAGGIRVAGGRLAGEGARGVGTVWTRRGYRGWAHHADAAQGTELRRVTLDCLQLAQVRPRAEEGGGGDDERGEWQQLVLRRRAERHRLGTA